MGVDLHPDGTPWCCWCRTTVFAHFTGEHEGAAFGRSVPANGGQILHRILSQEFYNFVYGKRLFIMSEAGGTFCPKTCRRKGKEQAETA